MSKPATATPPAPPPTANPTGEVVCQHGNVTTRQASQAGLTKKQLRKHVVSGALEVAGARVQAPFHVMLDLGRYVERPPHHIHTTIELPATDRTRVQGIPVLTADRAIIDSARQLSRPRLTTAYDVGLRDRKYIEDMIHRRIVELRPRTARHAEAHRG